MAENNYYVRWKGKRSGPYSADEILGLFDTRRITRLYQVSHDGVTWLPAEDIIALLRPPVPEDSSARANQGADEASTRFSSIEKGVPTPLVLKSDRVREVSRPYLETDSALENHAWQKPCLASGVPVPFEVRTGALLVDAMCVLGIIAITSVVLIVFMLCARFERGVILSIMRLYVPLLVCIISWMYEVGFSVSRMNATPGKYWLGLRVITEDHLALSLACANSRFFAKVFGVLLCGIGWLPVYGAQKSTLHDLLCHTQVSWAKEFRED